MLKDIAQPLDGSALAQRASHRPIIAMTGCNLEGRPALAGWSQLLPLFMQTDLHDDLDPNGQNHHNQKQEKVMGGIHHTLLQRPAGLSGRYCFLAPSFQHGHSAAGLASPPPLMPLFAPEP
jgi:hypothetical protein